MSETSQEKPSQERLTCPLCEGQLEAGFIPDRGQSTAYRLSWYPGKAEESMFFGDIQWPRGRRFLLQGFRCKECGHVLLFARKEVQ